MGEPNSLPPEEANALLANLATSLSTLSTALAARVDDGSPAYVAFMECVEREVRRLNESGQELIAGAIGKLHSPGFRALKEGW